VEISAINGHISSNSSAVIAEESICEKAYTLLLTEKAKNVEKQQIFKLLY
jgi:hypothetical protein